MAFNIFAFNGTLSKQNVSISSHFDVIVVPPAKVGTYSSLEDLTFRAETAELPSRSLITTPYRDYGPTREFSYNAVYPPVNVTFLASRDLRERAFFNQWQQASVGDFSDIPTIDGKFQNVNYFKDYTGTVILRKYDENGNKTFTIHLLEAYPRTVNQVSLASNDNEPVRIVVSFQYSFFAERVSVSKGTDIVNQVTNALSQPRRFAQEAVRGAVRGAVNNTVSSPVARGVLNRAAGNVIRI